jgi:hypothetical protein
MTIPEYPAQPVEVDVTPLEYPTEQPVAPTPPPKRKRSIGAIIAIVLLSLALVGAAVVGTLVYLQLTDANDRISEQDEEIKQQQELIDQKETFGAAMESLLDTAGQFENTLYGTIVPTASYQLRADRAYTHRWDADKLDDDIAQVADDMAELTALIDAAGVQLSSNSTGSVYEAVTDELGGGYVTSLLYDADTFCQSDVLACVDSEDPYTVHFDEADNNVEYTNDFIRTGVAYHEFAHVLQFTNPEPTDAAVEAFGGDEETMADCFALTFLDGWKLDHRIFINRYQYYDVSIGYGYTCNDSQRQVIRDWYAQLGYKPAPISQ